MINPFKSKINRASKTNAYIKAKKRRQKKRLYPSVHRPETLSKPAVSGSSWKVSGLVGFTSLLAVILVIPTLIVVPFIDAGPAESTVEEKPEPVELDNDSSHMSVSVMRSETNETKELPLEQYVTGVVSAEMPADFEIEALKAQALAARTYIVNRLIEQADDSDAAPVTDTVSDQVYKSEDELRERWGDDYNRKINRVKQAVKDTQGEILTYNDVTITPAFFSTSNGYTENSGDYWEDDLPYLRSVKSPWDKDSPKFLDQKTFALAEIEKKLDMQIPRNEAIQMSITRTDSNRVETLNISGHSFTGRTVREELNLRSSDFKIEHKNDHLIFTTKGFGHGIGMSQYGADGMAEEGKTYKDIVHHYYKDVNISAVDETAPKLVFADNKQ